MKLTNLLLWGGAAYFGYKYLLKGGAGGCEESHLKTIAGIYGMPLHVVGAKPPDTAGAQGGIVIYDTRNGKCMMHVLSGNCGEAAAQASTAVAQAGGNRMFANKAYDGSCFSF